MNCRKLLALGVVIGVASLGGAGFTADQKAAVAPLPGTAPPAGGQGAPTKPDEQKKYTPVKPDKQKKYSDERHTSTERQAKARHTRQSRPKMRHLPPYYESR